MSDPTMTDHIPELAERPSAADEADILASAPLSARRRFLRRFKSNRGAMVAFAFIVLMILVAIVGPWLAPKDPNKQALAGRLGGPEAFATLVHPRAWVSASAKLGPGAVVGPFADVSADSQAGVLLTLNGYSSLGHDVTVGDFVTLSGYVDLTGGVTVGEAKALDEAAEMLEQRRLPPDALPSPEASATASPTASTEEEKR